ncbi:MAG: helix-turn-helix transcriptional regulator [Homoserinimonas sp.]
MARMARKTPAELAPKPWPSSPSDDHAGEVARQFTLNLRDAIGTKSIRAAAEAAGVNHSTLLGIMEGRTWPDLETIAKIEHGLQADLWPGRLGA